MRPKLYKRVRFLALSWDDDFGDRSNILLYPFVRYYVNGESLEHIVQEGQLEYAIAAEKKEPVFHNRVWRDDKAKIPYLKRVAHDLLQGKNFPRKRYRLREVFCEFTIDRRGDAEWDNDQETIRT